MTETKENNITDEELIRQCLKNKRYYQEILYKRYADKMYTTCLIYSNNEEDACDILQSGFIKIFRKLHQFDTNRSFEAWIRKIMINTALEMFRKNKRERKVFEEYYKISEPNHIEISNNLGVNEIIKLVNMLPARAKMVLKLFAIEGYSHIEISELMGISIGTSKSQLNRARTILKRYITKNG